MSRQTLDSILAGGPLSENMLFRIRNSLEYASQHPGISIDHSENVYPGDWRGTGKQAIQDAIGVVTEKLVLFGMLFAKATRYAVPMLQSTNCNSRS